MKKKNKHLGPIMSGKQDKNTLFAELCRALETMGFDLRVNGSHHIYTKEGIPEILNVQPDDNMAKPYQVKQVRELIKKYNLEAENE